MRLFAVLLCLVLAIAGCGKKGPLVYPEMLVPGVSSNIMVNQFGSSLKISFVLPSKDLAGRKLTALSGVSVFKRDVPASHGPGCSSCTADFTLFRKINLDLLQSGTQRYGNSLVLLDEGVTAGRIYTYRVSVTTNDNLEGALSAPASAEMIGATLPPVLQIVNQPTDVKLEFLGLPPNAGMIVGYNVYRAVKGEAYSFIPLNYELVEGKHFVDAGLDRDTTYVYRVRSIARLLSGSIVESNPSNEVEGKLKDDE